MADTLEQRVETLEREVSAIKAKTEPHAAELATIPALLASQHRATEARLLQIMAEIAELKTAVLRAMAAMLERDK